MPVAKYGTDWWLNWIIPSIIILIMIGVIYIKFKNPINVVIGWFKSLFEMVTGTKENLEKVETITYGN